MELSPQFTLLTAVVCFVQIIQVFGTFFLTQTLKYQTYFLFMFIHIYHDMKLKTHRSCSGGDSPLLLCVQTVFFCSTVLSSRSSQSSAGDHTHFDLTAAKTTRSAVALSVWVISLIWDASPQRNHSLLLCPAMTSSAASTAQTPHWLTV